MTTANFPTAKAAATAAKCRIIIRHTSCPVPQEIVKAKCRRRYAMRYKKPNLTEFIYENRRLFSMLYHNNLISVIMRALEDLIPAGESYDKSASYLMSYFIYGYFGIIYRWIKYDFDETLEEVQKHIAATIAKGMAHETQ